MSTRDELTDDPMLVIADEDKEPPFEAFYLCARHRDAFCESREP